MAPKVQILVAAAALLFVPRAEAQTATQVVQFQVTAINQVAVTGSPAPLAISTATAGEAPAAAESGSSYAITTNEANKKITASLDQPLPAGVTLEVSLAAPAGASSPGRVALGTGSADVVTGISATNASGLAITYRLSATTTAQTTGPQARVVTFTIVSGS